MPGRCQRACITRYYCQITAKYMYMYEVQRAVSPMGWDYLRGSVTCINGSNRCTRIRKGEVLDPMKGNVRCIIVKLSFA